MKAMTVLPWILVIGLSAGFAAFYVSSSRKDSELTRLRAEAGKLKEAEAASTETRERVTALQNEVATLRGDKQELLRLRGEVTTLRRENQQLVTQVRTAQSQAQSAQAQAQNAQAQAAQTAQAAQAAQASAQQVQQAAQLNMCVNQLRQLDGAKQQWALENSKTAEAIANPQEVAPYFGPNGMLPKCPAGGTYTINAVGKPPTCTIPGHALPQPQ